MPSLRNITINPLLVAMGILIGLLIMELFVSLSFPQGLRTIVLADPFYGKYDPEIGWRNKENALKMRKLCPALCHSGSSGIFLWDGLPTSGSDRNKYQAGTQ